MRKEKWFGAWFDHTGWMIDGWQTEEIVKWKELEPHTFRRQGWCQAVHYQRLTSWRSGNAYHFWETLACLLSRCHSAIKCHLEQMVPKTIVNSSLQTYDLVGDIDFERWGRMRHRSWICTTNCRKCRDIDWSWGLSGVLEGWNFKGRQTLYLIQHCIRLIEGKYSMQWNMTSYIIVWVNM